MASKPKDKRRPRADRGAPERRGIRSLPKNFEHLAAGSKPPPRPRRPRLHDTRDNVCIAGVPNRDARRVYDWVVARLRDPAEREQHAPLLCDALRLRLWRARLVTGFRTFAEDVLQIEHDEARRLAEIGARAQGVELEPLGELDSALWLRAQAALLEHGGGRVSLAGDPPQLKLELPADNALAALAALGQSESALLKYFLK